MNTKLILKGVLLCVTTFAIILFIAGIDNIYDNGYFIQSLVAIIIMCYTCYKLISKEEFEKISLYRWLNKIIGD